MSLQRGIQQFLDGMDSTILARGKDYYRSGQVEGIDWDKNHVTAEVSGSEEELYLVELFPFPHLEIAKKMSRLVRGQKKYAIAVSICSTFLVVYRGGDAGAGIARADFLNNPHQATPLFCPLFWWYMRGQRRSRKQPGRISYIVPMKFGTFCPKAGAGQRATL